MGHGSQNDRGCARGARLARPSLDTTGRAALAITSSFLNAMYTRQANLSHRQPTRRALVTDSPSGTQGSRRQPIPRPSTLSQAETQAIARCEPERECGSSPNRNYQMVALAGDGRPDCRFREASPELEGNFHITRPRLVEHGERAGEKWPMPRSLFEISKTTSHSRNGLQNRCDDARSHHARRLKEREKEGFVVKEGRSSVRRRKGQRLKCQGCGCGVWAQPRRGVPYDVMGPVIGSPLTPAAQAWHATTVEDSSSGSPMRPARSVWFVAAVLDRSSRC
jgi:hypothetical protein